MKKLTLKEVAEKLNVSTATLSNAFNRPSQLSQELRESILQQCKDIGYLGPSASSRKLRTNKTRVIGVMLSHQLSYSFSDPVANKMLQGLSEIFEEPEYNLLVMPARHDVQHLSGIESFVEGFIVYGPPAQDRLEELLLHRKAIIAVDFTYKDIVSINIDNRQAAREIADHAFSHKPEQVGILALRCGETSETNNDSISISQSLPSATSIQNIHLHPEASNIMVQRLNGFKQSAMRHEIYIPDSHIMHINENNQALAYQACYQLLTQSPKIKTLLCMSDRCAISAIKAAKDLGLRVPEDIMITGFDGIDSALNHTPSITTIKQPSLEKGRLAAQMFLGQRSEESTVLNAQLFVGDSCPSAM